MDVDRAITELYAKPLEEFVAERDRLVAELKAAGDKRASEIKALRKPGLPVWAVNRLAAEHAGDLKALLAVGARLRDAHAELLAGGDPDDVRKIANEEREAIGILAGHASSIVEAAGQKPSPSTLERISATLSGLATDPAAAEKAAAGRLDREIARGGFDEAGAGTLPAVSEERLEARRAAQTTKAAVRRAREAADKARRRADELAKRAEETLGRAEEMAAEAERLARRASEAREAAEESEAEAVGAEKEAARLEREASAG